MLLIFYECAAKLLYFFIHSLIANCLSLVSLLIKHEHIWHLHCFSSILYSTHILEILFFFIHLFLLQFPPSARLIFRPNVTTSDSQLTHNLLFVLILQKKDPNNSDNVRIRKSSQWALEHPELFKRKCFMSRKSHAGFHDENNQTKQYEANS